MPKGSSWRLKNALSALGHDKGEVTYSEFYRNIWEMVRVRKSIIMNLEEVLAKEKPNKNEIQMAMSSIMSFFDEISLLIETLDDIVHEINDDGILHISFKVNDAMSETLYHDSMFRRILIGNFSTEEFEEHRVQLNALCVAMKRMLVDLCDMKIPSHLS